MNPPPRPPVYPFPTELRVRRQSQGKTEVGGCSVFLTVLRHQVRLPAFADWWQDSWCLGWRLHECLTYPKHDRCTEGQRRFQPKMALSPGAADTLFGETFPS